MSTDREIALEQALVAVIGAAQDSGVSAVALAENAKVLVIDNSKYRFVDHPHVSGACAEIESAKEKVGSLTPGFQTGVKSN